MSLHQRLYKKLKAIPPRKKDIKYKSKEEKHVKYGFKGSFIQPSQERQPLSIPKYEMKGRMQKGKYIEERGGVGTTPTQKYYIKKGRITRLPKKKIKGATITG